MLSFQVIGHRGAAGHAPENTESGFRLALRLGVDAIELDVHLSRDDVPVVIHDATLDRTTDGSGPVAAASSAELKRLDAGGWFHPGYRATRIPFLGEVLALVGNRVPVVVELKGQERVKELVARCVEAVESSGAAVVFSSFSREALAEARRQAPHIPRAWLFSGSASALDEALTTAGELTLHELCPAARDVSVAWVQQAHAAGYAVRTWGVPSQDTREMVRVMRHLVEAGADGSTADFPDVLRTTVLACEEGDQSIPRTERVTR